MTLEGNTSAARALAAQFSATASLPRSEYEAERDISPWIQIQSLLYILDRGVIVA